MKHEEINEKQTKIVKQNRRLEINSHLANEDISRLV